MAKPTRLRVEHVEEPLGITVPAPRLSWRLPKDVRAQVAYRIRAGEWDSGRVESDRSVLVPYSGPPLRSGQRVDWTVKVWTDAGESDWADAAWWEMGLLAPEDWVARWIEPVDDVERMPGPRPAWLLRATCVLDGGVERARLYATAHGIYELFVNGRRVGDAELTPGWTSYPTRVQVQTFDVTDLLVAGENVLGAVVSDGWYRGQVHGGRVTDFYGDTVALLAQADVRLADGSRVRFGTGPGWHVGTGAIRAADLFEGQVVDLGLEPKGWCEPGGRVADWAPVVVREHDLDRLVSSPAPPVRRVEEIRPVSVTSLGPGRQVVDLGQNVNGWVRLSDLGPAGTSVTLTYGEALDADGDVTQDNVWSYDADFVARTGLANMTRPFQVDRVISAGEQDAVFEPRHTTHGFRYVRVEGHPATVDRDSVTGVVVHTDLRRTGWFECDDERINRLHEAAVLSFRGNACDIPTDCPTRERGGWTGDWQLFVPTAAYLYDVAGFSAKWLADLAAEQRPDGLVYDCAPNTLTEELLARIGVAPGSAGWGDAAVIVPWEIYRAYGDTDVLARQWDSMTAWVDYAARVAREHRHPSRAAARPEPAEHERYLWDTGFHYGEWLEPGDDGLTDRNADEVRAAFTTDRGDVATAYLHYSSRLLAEIARILHRDPAPYDELAAGTKAAWQAEYLRPDGTLTRDTQAGYVRALAFGLAPGELRPLVADRLVQLIRDAGTHLGTGFLATPYLLPVLADTGHLDLAYELLFQDTEPSWLTMIDRGATTIWESWSGIDADGTPHLSLNHYSKGAVVTFLHRYVAGIQLLDDGPGYRRFRIAPRPGGGLTTARAAHDSPYGCIESSWRLRDDRFSLTVTVPPGTSAEVLLPDGHRFDAQPGTSHYRTTF